MEKHPLANEKLEAVKLALKKAADSGDFSESKRLIAISSIYLDQVLCNNANEREPGYGCRSPSCSHKES